MFKKRFLSIGFAALLLTGALPAQAALTNFDGYINIDNGNPFGAVFGDTITGSAMYDDGSLTGAGGETAALSSLEIEFSGSTFNWPSLPILPFLPPEDVDFPFGLKGFFSDDQLIGIEFQGFTDSIFTHLFQMTSQSGFEIVNQAQKVVLGGCLDFDTGVCIDPTGGGTVPEPAPIALFAIGLLGFWVSKRQKQGPRLIAA